MAQLDVMMEQRIKVAVAAVLRFGRVVCSYLFGSQVEGTADRWSDIDVAVFVEGVESWDMHYHARVAAQVQKTAGDDVEIHFLPAKALQERDDASFAAWVLTHGVEVQI
jgi:predicted nucleotidyltransferase